MECGAVFGVERHCDAERSLAACGVKIWSCKDVSDVNVGAPLDRNWAVNAPMPPLILVFDIAAVTEPKDLKCQNVFTWPHMVGDFECGGQSSIFVQADPMAVDCNLEPVLDALEANQCAAVERLAVEPAMVNAGWILFWHCRRFVAKGHSHVRVDGVIKDSVIHCPKMGHADAESVFWRSFRVEPVTRHLVRMIEEGESPYTLERRRDLALLVPRRFLTSVDT